MNRDRQLLARLQLMTAAHSLRDAAWLIQRCDTDADRTKAVMLNNSVAVIDNLIADLEKQLGL